MSKKETSTNSEKRRIQNKKTMIAALCVALVLLVLFGLTFTQYVTRKIDGHAQYEPALFNTVLLGKLVDTDVVTTVESEQTYTVTVYTCTNPDCGAHISYGANAIIENCTVCPYCGQTNPYIEHTETGDVEVPFTVETFKQSLNGGKIAKNLDLSDKIEFGKRDENNVLKVAPGTETKNFGHVFFTVTNGTTVEDVYTTPEEGEEAEKTPQVANIADSDIRYKLHIITSNNLPLHYSLKDWNTGEIYELKDSLEIEESTHVEATQDKPAHTEITFKKQAASDYVVDASSIPGTTKDFVNGTRILKLNEDNSITVHQYELIITWPTSSVTKKIIYDDSSKPAEEETQYNNDSAYMKELENIQVLLEIESYVNYLDRTEDSDIKADGIIYLNSSPVKDGFYSLKKTTSNVEQEDGTTVTTYADVPFYAKKTARFDAFEETTIPGATGLFSYNYMYPFHIYNTNAIVATWFADYSNTKTYINPLTGKSETRKQNGQTTSDGTSLKDGHYEYTGNTYIPGTYNMVIAVPSGPQRMNKSNIDWGSDDDHKYFIVYKGETYVGEKSKEVVQSLTQTYDKDREKKYEEENVTQYVGYRFYKTVTPESGEPYKEELSLNFIDGTLQKEDIVLFRSSKESYVDKTTSPIEEKVWKDDFKIYLVKPSN